MNSYVKGALVFAGGYVAAGAVTSCIAHKSPRGLLNLEAIAKWPLVLKNLIQGVASGSDLPVDQAQVLAPLAKDLPGLKNGAQLPAIPSRYAGIRRPGATDGLTAGTSFDASRNDLPVAFRGVI